MNLRTASEMLWEGMKLILGFIVFIAPYLIVYGSIFAFFLWVMFVW